MAEKVALNVLTVGKSGAGKSSLINYLFGTDSCKCGSGEPQTKTYFDTKTYELSENKILNLDDTKGLEPNDYEEWKLRLKTKIEEKERKEIDEQYHAILYCVNASSGRIENVELELIHDLSIIFPIGVVLTHCIKGKKEESIEGMKVALQNSGIDKKMIFEVCNITGTLLSGDKLEQFGKENLITHINNSLFEKIKIYLPRTLKENLDNCIFKHKSSCYDIIDKRINALNGHSNNMYREVESEINNQISLCQNEVNQIFESKVQKVWDKYQKIYNTFFLSTCGDRPLNYSKLNSTQKVFLQKDFSDKVAEDIATAICLIIPLGIIFMPFVLGGLYKDQAKEEVDSSFYSIRQNGIKKIEVAMNFISSQS